MWIGPPTEVRPECAAGLPPVTRPLPRRIVHATGRYGRAVGPDPVRWSAMGAPRPRVLIVDDEPFIGSAMARALRTVADVMGRASQARIERIARHRPASPESSGNEDQARSSVSGDPTIERPAQATSADFTRSRAGSA